MTKKEWQRPRLVLLNANIIESGGGSMRFEQIKFLDGYSCGVAGTVVGTVVGQNQYIDNCYNNTCYKSYTHALSANGTLGTATSFARGLCS